MTKDFIAQFENLYSKVKLTDFDKRFIRDGIIDLPLFEKQSKRVLFIAKEHNYVTDKFDPNYAADYSKWWKQHVHLQFSHRISEWAHGILNDFPENFEELTYDQKHLALRSIAFINVKKSSGGSTSNPEVITSYIAHSRHLLLQQIEEIRPSLIVCCFRYDNYPNQLFGITMKRHLSNTFSYGTWNGTRILNFYHPSARKRKIVLYNMLKEAVKLL
jgi:hypothetical protein